MVGPASMFVIGMLMGGMNIRKVLTNKKAYFIALMRLIGFPFIALLILKISGLVGGNADGEEDPSDRISGDHCTCCFDSYADESGVWKIPDMRARSMC